MMMMNKKMINKTALLLGWLVVFLPACSIPRLTTRVPEATLPAAYPGQQADTTGLTARMNWRDYFDDPNLTGLIDTALANNREVNIMLQRIAMTRNEIQARHGEYLPFVSVGAGADVDKVGRYTRNGAVEEGLDIADGKAFPEFLTNLQFGLFATWELDVWHKLRNAQEVAAREYLAGIEGRNFLITNLVAEIAHSYYELVTLDNQLDNLEQNIAIQEDALNVVKLLQQAGRVTSLAVKRFQAEVEKNQSRLFDVKQQIIGIENRMNFLAGRTPQPVARWSDRFLEWVAPPVRTGLPSQLLANRPDIRQAELELSAADLDIHVARAEFLPSFGLKAGLGYQAFQPKYLLSSPESILFSLAGEAMAPLVNRNAIIAQYNNAGARQVEAAYEYEQRILNAYQEVSTQLSNVDNLASSYALRQQQVASLTESITIANQLFQSARADYMEVLLTQRDALEAKMELIETRKAQMDATVDLYRTLGGGWQ